MLKPCYFKVWAILTQLGTKGLFKLTRGNGDSSEPSGKSAPASSIANDIAGIRTDTTAPGGNPWGIRKRYQPSGQRLPLLGLQKITRSLGSNPVGNFTIIAGGKTSKVSPPRSPSGTLTDTSSPSSRWNRAWYPPLAHGGTVTRNWHGGDKRKQIDSPGFTPGGGFNDTSPKGPLVLIVFPCTKSSGTLTVNWLGGHASAWVPWRLQTWGPKCSTDSTSHKPLQSSMNSLGFAWNKMLRAWKKWPNKKKWSKLSHMMVVWWWSIWWYKVKKSLKNIQKHKSKLLVRPTN